MHRIGVISDTHGLLRPEVLEQLKDCEMILHGGDIDRQSVLDTLKQIAPVHAVRGNADKEWAAELPVSLTLDLYGIKIFMIHNIRQLPKELSGIDVVVYGHSHKYEEKREEKRRERYEEKRENGLLWLNPGSCGPRRFALPITMAILEIGDDGSLRVEKIDIPHQKSQSRQQETLLRDTKSVLEKSQSRQQEALLRDTKSVLEKSQSRQQEVLLPDAKSALEKLQPRQQETLPPDIKSVIEAVVRDARRGKSVAEIARKHKIGEELAEQICRMYFTHPGVDADGIMTKLGI